MTKCSGGYRPNSCRVRLRTLVALLLGHHDLALQVSIRSEFDVDSKMARVERLPPTLTLTKFTEEAIAIPPRSFVVFWILIL
jgi:hypothetical protein